MYILETAELVLKSGTAEDWNDLYRNLWSCRDTFRYMFARACDSEEAAKKRTIAYAEMHREVSTEFFVYHKETGQAIGIAGIKKMSDGVYTVTDIAMGLAFSGRGYGKQILRALVELAFDRCGAAELHYHCFEENTASRRLAESCGFRYTHSEQAQLRKNDTPVMLAYFVYRKGEI